MNRQALIWDLPLRLFHWLLAGGFFAAWITGEAGTEYRELHMQIGYGMLGLLLFRLIWGFIGPRHARFASWSLSPSGAFRTIKAWGQRKPDPSAGHNPAGSWMVLILLVALSIQVSTGLFTSDDVLFNGPWIGAVSSDVVDQMGDLHHINFDILKILVGLHLIAILLYWMWKRQNLITPMITGRKGVDPQFAIRNSRLLLAAIAAIIAVAVSYWLIVIAPPPEPALFDF